MTARYQVRIKDQTGTQVALVTDESPEFVSLYYSKIRNAPGQCRFEVLGNGETAQTFEVDGPVEVWRKVQDFDPNSPEPPPEFELEWEGFHTSEEKLTLENGTKRYVSHSVGYMDLIRREEIGYPAGTPQTSKSGIGETVIKEFIYENIGAGANDSTRLDNGTMPGLSIQTDYFRGTTWEGKRAWRPLLDVVQEVAEATGLVFDIVGAGAALFVFNIYGAYRGSDRTPENPGGFAPIVFSEANQNMEQPHLTRTRSDEINVVYVLGPGEESDRDLAVRRNEDSIALSPWNRRVLSRNSVQEDTQGDLTGLENVGDSILSERALLPSISFVPIQVNNYVYGKDYFFGDLVHVQYEDFEDDIELIHVEVTVNRDGEDIRFEFR